MRRSFIVLSSMARNHEDPRPALTRQPGILGSASIGLKWTRDGR